MLKKIIYSIFLVMLLLLNMALFTWYVNHLNLGDSIQASFDQSIVTNAQAEVAPSLPPAVYSSTVHPVSTNGTASNAPAKRVLHPIQSLNNNPSNLLEENANRVILKFKSLHTHLDDADRERLEEALTRLSVNPEYTVQILSGTEPVENNALSPQSLKLRSQAVARIIYPYTQNIKMQYRPAVKVSTMIVEFTRTRH
jgi:flagellar basal body-associated protein FliL